MVLRNPKGGRNVDLDICGENVGQSRSIKILGANLVDLYKSAFMPPYLLPLSVEFLDSN